MSKLSIGNFEDFEKQIGNELGVSEYLTISQEQINKFAEATLDHQWIHTDPEKAAKESPFKTTIAHGYLTLSIVPFLWGQIVEFENVKMLVNYGVEKLKFSQPALVESEVRLKATLKSVVNLRGIAKALIDVELQIKGNKKPALNATLILLYHFN